MPTAPDPKKKAPSLMDDHVRHLLGLVKRAAMWGVTPNSEFEREMLQALDDFYSDFGEWGDCDPGEHKGWVRPVGDALACHVCRGESDEVPAEQGGRRAA